MDSEINAELRILEFGCDPSEITKCLNLQPTSTWVKGEIVSKTGKGILRHQENGWAWCSNLDSEEKVLDFRDLFDDIFRNLNPIKDKFQYLPNNSVIQLACCAYIRNCAPAFTLDERIIKLLAEINASVDFDIYCLNASE
ncbi:DUF4279 domain-containing protein [Collimonas humicola]|uniref:DUF4279 domain-containing protein n=1 Tax=Collimonas humicola TaxID=2825886 RepID=UPI001B8C2C8E|nr:DUF4279 domain-containing protein [Collimonas humicola]